jgi:hypothetical protein
METEPNTSPSKPKILIYSNCHGGRIHQMFDLHPKTRNVFEVSYISNYEELQNERLSPHHLQLVSECDIFIYQPLNKEYTKTEYDINNIKHYLKPTCTVFRINYYRFRGFWYESTVKPYHQHGIYKFLPNSSDIGLHNSFANFNSSDKTEIRNKIDAIEIHENDFEVYFQKELSKFQELDHKSDVAMYDFFVNHYKTVPLFHDSFHPNARFFYEVFRQTVQKLFQIELAETDEEFIQQIFELTTWSQPILPVVKKLLNMNTEDKVRLFDGCYGSKIIHVDIYDYYYIRLSPANLEEYLSKIV